MTRYGTLFPKSQICCGQRYRLPLTLQKLCMTALIGADDVETMASGTLRLASALSLNA